jgi:lipopolysaccharide biosynthesis glycosyltransferase
MNAYVTIITPDYLHYALALRESLMRFNSEIKFYVLITEKDESLKTKVEKEFPGTTILFGKDICKSAIGKKIYDKYFINFKNEFRWSMKPVVVNYLTENLNYEKVFYLDCDLFFFNSYNWIFEKLNSSNAIITPHWRAMDPHSDPINFQILFNKGLFNAGFIAANNKSSEIMNWWAMACEYVCVKQPEKGFFDDQTHLNLLPVKFDKVEILKHRGCNVANWNQYECKRVLRNNGEVWINNEYPVVFIHFTESAITGILKGEDGLLKPYLENYAATIRKYNATFDIGANYNHLTSETAKSKSKISNGIMNRFKKWIYAGR